MKRANGTGSIVKLSGRRRKPWVARLPSQYDALNDKMVQPALGSYATRVEAEKALNAYLDNPYSLSELTLQDLYDEWSEWHFKKISASTVKSYEFGFTFWQALWPVKLNDINPHVLQKELDKMEGMSKSSIGHARLVISQLCKEAMRRQIYATDYSELLISPAAADPKDKDIFSRDDIDKMWSALGSVSGIEAPLLMIYTGMRIGELASCKIEYVNLEDRYILHGSKTSAGKNRIIPIPMKIYPLVEKLCKTNHEYLIERAGSAVSADYLRRHLYHPALERLNVKQLTPHACRRTYATMLNSGVKNKQFISAIMGHASFDTTDRYYIINQSKDLVQAVDFLQ